MQREADAADRHFFLEDLEPARRGAVEDRLPVPHPQVEPGEPFGPAAAGFGEPQRGIAELDHRQPAAGLDRQAAHRSKITIIGNGSHTTSLRSTFEEELDDNYVRNLALASSLHDVGKVGIPDSILLKPGRLSQAEREVMELHTLIGGECLEAIQGRLGTDNQFMQIAKQIAYYHHERWDGNGYPHGLEAEKIPVVARIVAVADVYDALTSKRPYKEPLSHIESKGIILSGSGSQFDPEVVAAFLRHEDEFEAISRPQRSISDDEARSEFHVLCERAQSLAD